MREILFRGKDVLDKEWIYGSLIIEKHCIGDAHFIRARKNFETDWTSPYQTTAVLPNTLGQYTGLTDKNGTKIFEGDIVNCRVLRLSANHSSWSQKTNKEHGKCRVLPMEIYFIEPYTDYNCRFGGIGFRLTQKAKQLIEEYEKPVGKETTNQLINWFNIDKEDLFEVIGNIYDNPELLEVNDA